MSAAVTTSPGPFGTPITGPSPSQRSGGIWSIVCPSGRKWRGASTCVPVCVTKLTCVT